MGEYSKALSSYERSLEIMKVALPPNHPLLAASYNNISDVYIETWASTQKHFHLMNNHLKS